MANTTLDPDDWDSFRSSAHRLLDDVLDKMETFRQGKVWNPMPAEMKINLKAELPQNGVSHKELCKKLTELLPYGVGNTHPRFFGWVHGAGNPGCLLAEMAVAAMNANLGGRDHGAIYVENQVIEWCRQMMGFPEKASGLIVSGTSMATIIAMKVARDQRLDFFCRKKGIKEAKLVGYASDQAHSCLGRAFDLLGLGSDSLRKIPCDEQFRMDLNALQKVIDRDRENGFEPFAVIGTAGSVNVGAIDDLESLVGIAEKEDIWLHIDGAFGATAIISDEIRPRLKGIERADSLAFDFHKWLQVNYDAGCVLVRSNEAHLNSFSGRAEYLKETERGLAAGSPWPVDYGPELSRSFRALKVWSHFLEHGVEKLAAVVNENCNQAKYLGMKIQEFDHLELLAPVTLNITCFRYITEKTTCLNTLNKNIVIALQERGIAAPSTTILNGRLAIRVNITNHRTEFADIDLLLEEITKVGRELANKSGKTYG